MLRLVGVVFSRYATLIREYEVLIYGCTLLAQPGDQEADGPLSD